MTSSIRILSTSSVDSVAPSLLLVNPDGTKYLVNCGEGSQRLMLEHQQRLSTVTAVCCPVLHHSSVMGLPGWILTATDVHKNTRSNQQQLTTTTTATAASIKIETDKALNEEKQKKQGIKLSPQHHEPQQTADQDDGGEVPAAATSTLQQQQLLHVFGPRGTREFVHSLRHFITPRGYGHGYGQGPAEGERDANGAPRQEQHGQHSPFGNVRVWEGAAESEDRYGPDLDHGQSSGSSTSNSGFDRFTIRCYAFDDNVHDEVNTNEAELERGDAAASAGDHASGTAAAESPTSSSHNKRLYSQVVDEDQVGDAASEEAVRSHESQPHPRDHQRQQRRQQELCFLFYSPPLPGKFLPQEAAKLGVPKGPLYGKLKAGQSVTFDSASITRGKKKNRKDSNNIKNDDVTAAPVASMVTVHPRQVVAPDSPGVAVLVLHYATKERLADILRSKDFCALVSPPPNVVTAGINTDAGGGSSNNNAWQLEVVVHMTPNSEWMDEAIDAFSSQPNVEHLFLSSDPMVRCDDEDGREGLAGDYGTPFRAAALGAATRQAICESVYQSPLLPSELLPDRSHYAAAPTNESPPAQRAHLPSGRYVTARTMMEYVLIPRAKRGWTKAMTPSPAADEAPTLASSSRWIHSQALDCVREAIDSDALRAAAQPAAGNIEDTGELFFTGTGSAIPCKHRNVTGMCVTATNGNRMLLDVGEGTVGQLLRRAGVATAQSAPTEGCDGRDHILSRAATMAEYLTSIRAVWISHSHADHHLGLLRLLQERKPLGENDPVLLIAPACIFQFLEKCEEIGLLGDSATESPEGSQPVRLPRYRAVHCWDLVTPPGGKPSSCRDDARIHLASAFGWTDVQAVPVDHCPNAFAVVLDGTPFGRLVYSGDCRPSRGLARLASPTDVLIHEATFEDGMEDEAKMKKHSTVGEALSVADEMNASCVVLTHFSQRYPRIPPLTTTEAAPCSPIAASRKPTVVVFAFDYMRLTPANLVAASRITDVLRQLYPAADKDDDE